jgi:hypothetical protein
MNNKDKINDLIYLREQISESIKKMDNILQIYFPERYSDAYQHWIPQILTALYNDLKWLPRGQVTLQDTIDHIKDCEDKNCGGVSKFIK